jgi:large repetitive protein
MTAPRVVKAVRVDYEPMVKMRTGNGLIRRVVLVVAATVMCVAIAGPASATPDATPPQLVGFSLSPATADISAGDVNIAFTFHITDDLSGLNSGGGGVHLHGPGGSQVNGAGFALQSGTALDGTYAGQLSIPQYSATGIWTVEIELVDEAGNQVILEPSDLATAGFPSQFTLTGTPTDSTPPQLVGLSFPTLVSPATPGPLHFTLHITDDLSGFWTGLISINNFGGSTKSAQNFTLISGSALNGVYVLTLSTDGADLSTSPRWNVTVCLSDRVGNTLCPDLAAAGLPDLITTTTGTDPSAPTIGTATAGNASGSVAFVPGSDGGSTVLHFDATCTSPNGGATSTASGAGSPIVVPNLTNGDSYTCSVTATNVIGTSTPSDASNTFVPATVPSAPTIGAVTAGHASGSVAFVAGSDGGSAVLHFDATCTSSDGGASASSSGSPIVVPNLTSGQSYTCSVTATNAIGTSAPSSTSSTFKALPPTASATPVQGAPGTLVSISGMFWDPTGGPVTVKFVAGSDVGTAVVDGSGNLTGSIAVGASEIVGSNPIIVTQNGLSLPIPFTVLASTNSGGGTSGHGACTVTPTAPRSPSSAPGNASATVSWGPALKPTQQCVAGDVVTPYLGGVAQTPTLIVGPATTTLIKGLINGDKYTFKIATENGSVEGPTSVMTAPITVGTPSQPTGLSAVKGHNSATLHWKAPKATNGKPLIGYAIRVFVGSQLVKTVMVGVTTRSTVTGLVKGKAYTFVVAAKNSRGTGVASTRSKEITLN